MYPTNETLLQPTVELYIQNKNVNNINVQQVDQDSKISQIAELIKTNNILIRDHQIIQDNYDAILNENTKLLKCTKCSVLFNVIFGLGIFSLVVTN